MYHGNHEKYNIAASPINQCEQSAINLMMFLILT